MKRLLSLCLSCFLFLSVATLSQAQAPPNTDAKREKMEQVNPNPSVQTAPTVQVQELNQADQVALSQAVEEPAETGGLSKFFRDHWVALLLGFLGFIEVVIRLTPSEKDNTLFTLFRRLLDAFLPNRKAGGGVFR